MIYETLNASNEKPIRRRLLLASCATAVVVACTTPALAQTTPPATSPPPETTATSEKPDADIVVTGTSIRGAKQPTGSGLIVVGRNEIDKSSASNTADLLAQVPVVNSFNTQPRVSDVGSSGSTAPGLRGLPSTATLLLLNGHRLVGDSPLGTAPDPTSIPPGAIERIEVVPDGASAVYGSDAVAGVINIITRKDVSGVEITGRYGLADGYRAFDINGVGGLQWNGGSLTIAGSYSGNGHLQNKQRDFYTPNKLPDGGQDNRDTNCVPPNVTIGGNLYAPPGYTIGAPVRCDLQGDADILSRNRRVSVLLGFDHTVTPGIRLFGDFKYTDTRTATNRPYPATSVTISNTNPFFFLPAGAVGTSESVDFAAANLFTRLPQYRYTTKAGGATLGADVDISSKWHLQLTGTYGWSDSEALNETFDAGALTNAANGTTLTTALDPFQNRTNAAVAADIQNYGLAFISHQSLLDLGGKIDGSLIELPGGALKVAVGGGYRRETYDARNPSGKLSALSGGPAASGNRDVTSAYGELLVPIVGASMNVPAISSLEFSAAVRYDHYSDFGDTTNPKLGLRWEVVRGVALRGSYGRSFHAPSLADTQSVDTRALYFANFPLSPGLGAVNTIALAGGNPNLKPERAKTYSAGIDITPPSLPGFKASATFYDVTYKDQVLSLISFFPFPLFSDPALTSLAVTVNPTPAQIQAITCCQALVGFPSTLPAIGQILDFRRANLSSTTTRGIDFETGYRWSGPLGRFNVGFGGVYTIANKIQASPSGANVDQFTGGRGAIRWRLRGDLGWAKGPAQIDVAVNYTGPYDLTYTNSAAASALQNVGSYTTVNLRASYDIKLLRGTSVMFNIDDVFNSRPPLVLGSLPGFDATRINPIGRMLWLGVRQKF